MEKTTHTKFIISIFVFLILVGLCYYFIIQKNNATAPQRTVAPQTKAQILTRLLAPLNSQSKSANIKDIKKDLDATDLSILDAGVKK